jgi:hypothetical protein
MYSEKNKKPSFFMGEKNVFMSCLAFFFGGRLLFGLFLLLSRILDWLLTKIFPPTQN